MNTLKQNTVREITFDCSISHKSENLIRQQSRQNMSSNWDQDIALVGTPVGGNSSSATPVNGLSRKTSLENMQTNGAGSYTNSPSLSRPPSMPSMGQFVRHGSQDSMRETLSRGNSFRGSIPGQPQGVVPPTPPTGPLVRTYSGNSSTSFVNVRELRDTREYFTNPEQQQYQQLLQQQQLLQHQQLLQQQGTAQLFLDSNGNELGRLTLQHSNRSIDSASTVSSVSYLNTSMPPSSSPLTTARTTTNTNNPRNTFLRGNSSNNSSSNSIIAVVTGNNNNNNNDLLNNMQSPRYTNETYLDESNMLSHDFRLGSPPLAHTQSHSRLPIPPSYNGTNTTGTVNGTGSVGTVGNGGTVNGTQQRTLLRPDSDLSINSTGAPERSSRHSRTSSQGSITSLGSFHNNLPPFTNQPNGGNNQAQQQQAQQAQVQQAQQQQQRSLYSQVQYESFYGEPIASVSLSASNSFYMKDLDSILSLSTTPQQSSYNLHSLIPQQASGGGTGGGYDPSSLPRSPRSRNQSTHSLLGDMQAQQASLSSAGPYQHQAGLDQLSSPLSDLNAASYILQQPQQGSPQQYSGNNMNSPHANNMFLSRSHHGSAKNIHQLMTNMHDPELDLIGPNEPLTVDLAGILNSL